MSTTKIMIIRHAEKPSKDGSIVGISDKGNPDPEELTVRGWQRAGALVRFFAPASNQFSHPALAKPDVIFASRVAPHSKSFRAQHTVSVLAAFLGIDLNLSHAKGEEDALVTDALSQSGTVLIAWEHEAIPGIVGGLVRANRSIPQNWPDDRFDIVWIVNPSSASDFTQVPQMLLPGDSPKPIPV